MTSFSFSSRVENFNTTLWTWHIKVPPPIADALHAAGARRLVCTLNEAQTIRCALLPAGDGQHFILLNKPLRDKLRLREGSTVNVTVTPDTSQYGMDMPEEFAACLADDPHGDELFHALTPGKQRTLIYIVSQVKNPDKRIRRSLVILDHLRQQDGKIDYKVLNTGLRNDARDTA